MKTKIFSHNGVIGAETDIENGKFINDIKAEGQMGCVISTKEVLITKDAIEILKNAERESDSFAPIMLTKHSDNEGSIGLLGFGMHLFKDEDLCIGRDCDISILDDCEILPDTEIPVEFKTFADSL
jgi:hypothetical protein